VRYGTGRSDGEMNWSDMAGLMARVQSGDREAYRTLLDLLIPWLRRVAGRKLNRIEDVEDTVQEVLVSLHAVRHTYDPKRPFQPWVMTLTQRRIADRMRKNYQLMNHESPLPADLGETFPLSAANDRTNPAVDLEPAALARAMANLSPPQRQAVELLRMREMSLKEAAAASGRTEASLKVAMHRALASLRRAFGVS
jgi:RNA polymerase sigma factor (sigma-70 family)